MSWSVNLHNVPYEQSTIRDELKSLREDALRQNPDCSDQFDAALEAALSVIRSGVVGPPSHSFSISLIGHSNPGHGPREGYAKDLVTINIWQE
jgi:hypothetical protein